MITRSVHDRLSAIKRALPAGEWADILPVEPGDSLMSDFTLYATATWLRGVPRPVFLKCIWPANDSAGAHTRNLTDPDRLEAIRARLSEIKKCAARVPIAEVLDCRLIEGGILVIAMEQVDIVRDLLSGGRGGLPLAVRILRDLAVNYNTQGQAWIHMDICPRNVGVTRGGRIVFIDPESCYLGSGGKFDVTSLWAKKHLQPQELRETIISEWIAGKGVSLVNGVQKYEYEVALVAAETSFGRPLDYPGQSHCADDWVEPWLQDQHKYAPDLAAFWLSRIAPASLRHGLDLERIADELERIPRPEKGAVHIDRETSVGDHPETSRVQAVAVPSSSDGFEIAWRQLAARAAGVRNDRLPYEEVMRYRLDLLALAQENATRAKVWIEILFIDICILRNPSAASQVLQEALTSLPHDLELQHTNRMVQQWLSVVERGRK